MRMTSYTSPSRTSLRVRCDHTDRREPLHLSRNKKTDLCTWWRRHVLELHLRFCHTVRGSKDKLRACDRGCNGTADARLFLVCVLESFLCLVLSVSCVLSLFLFVLSECVPSLFSVLSASCLCLVLSVICVFDCFLCVSWLCPVFVLCVVSVMQQLQQETARTATATVKDASFGKPLTVTRPHGGPPAVILSKEHQEESARDTGTCFNSLPGPWAARQDTITSHEIANKNTHHIGVPYGCLLCVESLVRTAGVGWDGTLVQR